MSFGALVQEVKGFPFQQVRYDYINYLELVIDLKYAKDLCLLLERHLGPPLKPMGREPSREAKQVTDPLGGIEKNQVLYCSRYERAAQCALLWPWADHDYVTVKIARLLESPREAKGKK